MESSITDVEANRTPNFYRRNLPSTCVSFSSSYGKKLFAESLVEGFANIYFNLAAQFLTQDEPAYCGLSTLVMVLNALDIDPGRIWKSPWRFYHETMLDCCLPLEVIKEKGINLEQFICLAECNKLEVEMKYADSSKEFLDNFRSDVKRSVSSENLILVLNYDRKILGQTGSGHFSPIGALNSDTDQILIMDVARFKYPPHWAKLDVMQNAMLSIDNDTMKQRGYLLLKLRSEKKPLKLFGLKSDVDAYKSQFAPRMQKWEEFLNQPKLSNDTNELKEVGKVFNAIFHGYLSCCDLVELVKPECGCCSVTKINSVLCTDIYRKIQSLDLYECVSSPTMCIFLLIWPIKETSERSSFLKSYLKSEREKLANGCSNAIEALCSQVEALSIACRQSINTIPV